MNSLQDSSCYRVSPKRTLRCNRTWCGRGTCRNKRRNMHCKSRLGYNPFSFFVFPNFSCQRGAANQAEILCPAKRAEMANIEQTKKIVPLITCEISFGQNLCELMFGANVTDFDFGSILILSNNQSRVTLWVRETCLIVGLRRLIIILITCPQGQTTLH